MTEFDKVRLGMDAENVLNSDAMKKVAKDIKDMLYQEFEDGEDTPEGDMRARALRAEAKGMKSILVRLRRLKDEGSAERKRQQAAEAAEPKEIPA